MDANNKLLWVNQGMNAAPTSGQANPYTLFTYDLVGRMTRRERKYSVTISCTCASATEPAVGLDYGHHRYYDPSVGRFISPDVGQSGNISARLAQHVADSRLGSLKGAKITPVTGGKFLREIAEQNRIDAPDGIK